MLIQITARNQDGSVRFCAGIDYPYAYAPILAFMKGWLLDRIMKYCWDKGWKYKVINVQ